MNETRAKEFIESLKPLQVELGEKSLYDQICPRCGEKNMDKNPMRNALSRYADVYICDACGVEEAIRDMHGNAIPLTQWAVIKKSDKVKNG